MKNNFTKSILICLMMTSFFACQKDTQPTLTSEAGKKVAVVTESCDNYQVELVADIETKPGSTIFTWTITNLKPGNGSKGTSQNLSHWDFVPSQCLQDNWNDITEASYSTDGVTFNTISNRNIEIDPSLKSAGTFNDDVFKFNQGTSGNTPTRYRLVILGTWDTQLTQAYFKSGVNTGYCQKEVLTVGCQIVDEDCSLSQGFWFANNTAHPLGVHPWANTVTIGDKEYTNQEGLAIWNSSNNGGIRDSKKAFTQLASIRISGVDETTPELITAVNTIEAWLKSLPKLDAANLPNQTASEKTIYGDAKASATVISDWININHCSK